MKQTMQQMASTASWMEGVVAKRLAGRYRPGERGWLKTKNRARWRYPLEVEAAIRRAAG